MHPSLKVIVFNRDRRHNYKSTLPLPWQIWCWLGHKFQSVGTCFFKRTSIWNVLEYIMVVFFFFKQDIHRLSGKQIQNKSASNWCFSQKIELRELVLARVRTKFHNQNLSPSYFSRSLPQTSFEDGSYKQNKTIVHTKNKYRKDDASQRWHFDIRKLKLWWIQRMKCVPNSMCQETHQPNEMWKASPVKLYKTDESHIHYMY